LYVNPNMKSQQVHNKT